MKSNLFNQLLMISSHILFCLLITIDDKLWFTGGGAPVFFLTDHLGSTRALVSSSGATLGTITYDSFGLPIGITGTIGTRFLYARRDYDADTELYYYRARWYDPQARRFISEDPIGLNGGINLYAYVGNNPMNRIDPWGLLENKLKYKNINKPSSNPWYIFWELDKKSTQGGWIVQEVTIESSKLLSPIQY